MVGAEGLAPVRGRRVWPGLCLAEGKGRRKIVWSVGFGEADL